LPYDREVWPAGDSFGAADAEPEEDFMALREILFADLGSGGGYTLFSLKGLNHEMDWNLVDWHVGGSRPK
jgi:hypothetical protein